MIKGILCTLTPQLCIYACSCCSQAEESTAEHDIPSILDDGTASLFTFGLLFGIYVGCLHPSVPGGDSGKYPFQLQFVCILFLIIL